MAEEVEKHVAGAAATGADPAAAAIALDYPGTLDPRSAAYLEKQTRLTELQIADLEREDALRHWSLRVRHVSDVFKLSFEFGAALVFLTLGFFIMIAIWTAAHDRALVIEAFNVPSDMAANGLTGQVVATQLESRLAWMQAHTDTMRAAETFKNSWTNDIKVQIPDTGVSIGEAYRALVGWLGHQTHITGALWRAQGRLTIAVRSGASTYEFTGREANLEDLIAKGADRVYRDTQPYRYGVLLMEQGRPEARAVFRDLALYGPANEKPWAWMGWGLMMTGDLHGQLEKERVAAALEPGLSNFASDLADAEFNVGHDEAGLAASRKTVELFGRDSSGRLAAHAAKILFFLKSITISEMLGDYRAAVDFVRQLAEQPEYYGSAETGAVLKSLDLARQHDLAASLVHDPGVAAVFAANGGYGLPSSLGALRAMLAGQWRKALDILLALQQTPIMTGPDMKSTLPYTFWPWLADAYASNGMFAAAHAWIDRTPTECYLCVRMRASLDTREKRWNGAAYWYARATKMAPSIPFAYADWGAMLLQKGDLDGAIAQLEIAHKKGPRFADPLEMWGEALIAKNRSDLALAKFEEANKYATRWGRLHLKWGEALWWSGDKDGARKQFAIAPGLDLTPAEKSELAKVAHG